LFFDRKLQLQATARKFTQSLTGQTLLLIGSGQILANSPSSSCSTTSEPFSPKQCSEKKCKIISPNSKYYENNLDNEETFTVGRSRM
jgi:hypothetical protein